ncbi:hypothetical protein [Bizionia paragorgiae]|uniref:50S ribosomal protein L27 n=1 Tax=Bizionia paragorgiae TaxID=283786 RepID=A0A1H3YRN8_BIZPA|nr:hypothetical protein [Bizionia paragorgiae]SEA14205.1 hypothetical protein SAMN04487990_10761 [Bizionia paragorgiae]
MYTVVKDLHSYWAYLVVIMVVVGTVNALVKFFGKKEYGNNDFRIALFTLIVTHIQLLIGLVLYFTSPLGLSNITANGMGGLNAPMRLLAVEHPFVGILAVICITVGYSKHKKKLSSTAKFKPLAIFYTIGLLLILSRIPWSNWM